MRTSDNGDRPTEDLADPHWKELRDSGLQTLLPGETSRAPGPVLERDQGYVKNDVYSYHNSRQVNRNRRNPAVTIYPCLSSSVWLLCSLSPLPSPRVWIWKPLGMSYLISSVSSDKEVWWEVRMGSASGENKGNWFSMEIIFYEVPRYIWHGKKGWKGSCAQP